MNIKRFTIGAAVVFIYVFFYEWLFHGVLLEDMYAETANLWRSPEEREGNFRWLLLGQFIFAVLFSFIFTLGYESKGLLEGLRYGVLIGLLFVGTNIIIYAVQPIPGRLLIAWIVGGLLEVALAGMIMAAIYRPAKT